MNLSALGFRDFRIYIIGNMFALNGLWMQRVTLGWIAWDLTSSASFVGFVAFVNFAPTVITGPFFGVLIDRIKVKRAALITQASMLLLALALFASFITGQLGPVMLSVLSGISGVVASAHHPVRMSLAPRLVERGAIASVVTLTAINFNLARLTGPALGGWIIATGGVGPSLFIQVLCYLPFILAISFLRPRQRQFSSIPTAPFLQALRVGIIHVIHNRLIRHAIMITGIFAFIIRGTLEILPVLADGVFDKGAAGLGFLTSSAGLGALVAGMTKAMMPAQATRQLPRPALVSALVGAGIIPILGNSSSWELSLFLIGCLGFMASISAISMQTAIQVDLDDDLRGRVMSLWVMVGIGAAAGGAVILGFLTDQIGFAPTLSWLGSVEMIFLGWIILRIW
ncbi:MAG: MFS transporter [Hyphomicrobiales bacterium]|nr:MFS transporter [Hyphomicrobiales bacterium]